LKKSACLVWETISQNKVFGNSFSKNKILTNAIYENTIRIFEREFWPPEFFNSIGQ